MKAHTQMTNRQKATDRLTPWYPATGSVGADMARNVRAGVAEVDCTETRASVVFMAGILTSLPLWSGVGDGF